MSRRSIIKLSVIVFFIIAFFVFCYFQNNYLTVSNFSYESEKIPESFDGFTVLQISDLHNKEFGKNNVRLTKKINEISPDAIFITGDMIDGRHNNLQNIAKFVIDLSKRYDIYFAPGNHEYSIPDIYSEFKTSVSGHIAILEDQATEIIRGDDSISVVGFKAKLPVLPTETQKSLFSSDTFSMLLAHYPENLELYSEAGADLVFSGHAHGGQWRLPWVGGLFSPAEGLFPKYTEGMHSLNNTTMVISRGLGSSKFPLRLFNYPEIVVVTLHSK